MSCCCGKNTNAIEPKKSLSDQSDPPSNKPIIPVTNASKPKIEYSISVKTGDFRNSSTNGPVYINIFGRDGQETKDLLLPTNEKPFAQGSLNKFQVNAVDIGKPQRVIIRHEDQSTGWYVDYVEISVHNFLVRFVANRWLNRLKNDRKLDVELFGSEQPATTYEIEVHTGDEQENPLDSPAYIQIFGTTTNTPKLFLESKNAAFTKDSKNKFTISSNNVGVIQRIVVGHEGLGQVNDWYLKAIKVQMLDQNEEYTVDQWLSPVKGNQRLFVELSREQPQSPSPRASPVYSILVQTADVSQTSTTENVEMIVRGSEGQIVKFPLKEHAKVKTSPLFQRGHLDEFEVEHPNIGNIGSITIGFSDSKQKLAWLLEEVTIKYQEQSYHFRAHCWLSNRLGPNFSWMTIKPDSNEDEIQYKVTVKTGQAGVDANVILCIFGDGETTPNLPLRQTSDGADAKFTVDSTAEFHLKAVDVGKIKKINIGHDGKGAEQQWFLKSVTIEKKDEIYQFKAHRWLGEEKEDKKTYVDLLPVEDEPPSSSPAVAKEQAAYDIIVVTSSDDHAGTDSGVLMTIFGDKDATKQFPLTHTKQGEKAAFDTGKTNEFHMKLDDVGEITKINIGQDGTGQHKKWHLHSVEIRKGSQTYNFLAKKVLDQSTAFVDLSPTPPSIKKTPTPEPPKLASPRNPSPKLASPRNPSPKLASPRNPTPERRGSKKEIPYKVTIHTDAVQQDVISDETPLYLIIHGQHDQTKKLVLKDGLTGDKKHAFSKNGKADLEFKSQDVGKIQKIVIGQEKGDHGATWHVDNVTIKHGNETTTFNAERAVGESEEIELVPSAIPKKNEINYKVLVRTGKQQDKGDGSQLYVTIIGSNGQTKRIPLNDTTKVQKKVSFDKEETIEFEFKENDVGKISKIILSQDAHEKSTTWHIEHITIKQGSGTTTFNVDRKLERQDHIVLLPSPILTKSETPRRVSRAAETEPKLTKKIPDADYEITVSTGEQGLDAALTMRVHGRNGVVSIPLSKTTSGAKPFQAKTNDEFTCRTTDVGRIRRIHLEHNEKDQTKVWHLKSVQIKKGKEVYDFNADIRLDDKENQVNLYPVGALYNRKEEDFVQTELRRLREGLRVESSKLRPPSHKPHEPYLFNDLGPYFDTRPVERAIYAPLETPPGYYTRVTALRIVEPWEAYGMDYGVNYELLRQRRDGSLSARRPGLRSADQSIDRSQGSTHLPKFPCVNMKKPREYSRVLNMNDVPKIRSFIRGRYTAQAQGQIKKDYQRTREDLYRMQLDHLEGYHESNRDNMVRIYHSYLENTPGSKKALRELCDQLAPKNMQTSV